MVSLRQLIYNIKNIPNGGITSDDFKVSDLQLAFIINYRRAKLLREDYQKRRMINHFVEQKLECVEMDLVDSSECCDIQTDCHILKSKKRLPSPLNVDNTYALESNSLLLTFIGSVDTKVNFPYVSEYQARWASYNRFTATARRSFLRDGFLYVINDNMIEVVTVHGIFEDPTLGGLDYLLTGDASCLFNTCSDEADDCYSLDHPYPISQTMIGPLTEIVLSKEMMLAQSTLPDLTNNMQSRVPGETYVAR